MYGDARSVFVGNLHRNVTHFELKTLFTEAGIVVDVHLAKRQSKKGTVVTYAFVEFIHPTSVWIAVLIRDGHIHRGFPMRVQMRKNVFGGNYLAAQTLFQHAPNAYGQPSLSSQPGSLTIPFLLPSQCGSLLSSSLQIELYPS